MLIAIASLIISFLIDWGLAKKGKVICYDVGRVLAPAADGRSYCNRTACRQDAGVIGTHLRTSAYLYDNIHKSVSMAGRGQAPALRSTLKGPRFTVILSAAKDLKTPAYTTAMRIVGYWCCKIPQSLHSSE